MKTAIALASLIGLLGFSCVDNGNPIEPIALQLDASANGKTITGSVGQRFTVTLDSWGDAGYQWGCQIADSLIVSQEGQVNYNSAEPNGVGGLWIATITFSLKHAGSTVVTLVERQLWMKDVPPRVTVTFAVLAID